MNKNNVNNGASLGFETMLWDAANKMRGHMDPAEFKYIMLGLIFLKYITDIKSINEIESRIIVPSEARWDTIKAQNEKTNIGKLINNAMRLIEDKNPSLKGILPKTYYHEGLSSKKLFELIILVDSISEINNINKSRDFLGRIYEYFLDRFAASEGRAGEFYTPQSVVRLLVEMIEPYKGRIFDPCCGSGGMFVSSDSFVRSHGGKKGDIGIFGQESNIATWKLAKMNLALRGLKNDLGEKHEDSFLHDLHKDLKADFILANPPFNQNEWGSEKLINDNRWQFGLPPANNANFAWIQHIIHHLAPNGKAGIVLANGSLSSNQTQESRIRKNLIDADLIDCVVYLPVQLFYTTQISVSLWFIAKNKHMTTESNRRGRVLFIYAYNMGKMVDRTHRELIYEEILQIALTYKAWRSKDNQYRYKNIPGFCYSATREEIAKHKDILVPGRYVGFNRVDQTDIFVGDLYNELDELQKRLETSRIMSEKTLHALEGLLNGRTISI